MKLTGYLLIAFMLLSSVSCGKKTPPHLIDYDQLPAPALLGTVYIDGKVHLRWLYPSEGLRGLVEFIIYKDGKRLAVVSDNEYVDSEVHPGGEYKYSVVAKDSTGRIGESSGEIDVRPEQPPAPPYGLAFEIMPDTVVLKWMHDEDGVKFNIYRSGRPDAFGINPINSEPSTEKSYVTGVEIDTGTYYAVRALRGGPLRNESYLSEPISIEPEDFIPSPPKMLKAVVLESEVVLLWEENSESWVNGYSIYSSDDGESFKAVGFTAAPLFRDKSIPEKKKYYYIRAKGPVLEGPPSEKVSVKTAGGR